MLVVSLIRGLYRLQVVLQKQFDDEMRAEAAPGEMVTEVVEEFISIADGQVCLSIRA